MMSGLSYYNRGILPPAIENTHSAFLLHDIDGKIYHKTKWISRCSLFFMKLSLERENGEAAAVDLQLSFLFFFI